MSASYEVQLIALAVGLYIFDSSLLLYADDGVLIAGHRGKWHAILGSDEFLFLKRSLYIANLFAPHVPAFRLTWRFDEPVMESASTAWTDLAAALRPVAPFTIAAGIALYLLLPIGLFTRLGPRFVLIAVALLYTNIILALSWLYPHRLSANLRGRRFAALAFECIACPPFAVNLVRRVCLAQTIPEQFPSAAERLLSADEWAHVKSQCAHRIEDELDAEQLGSLRAQALTVQRERFRSDIAHDR